MATVRLRVFDRRSGRSHLIRASSGPFATINDGQSRSTPEHRSGRRNNVEERSGGLPKLTVQRHHDTASTSPTSKA